MNPHMSQQADTVSPRRPTFLERLFPARPIMPPRDSDDFARGWITLRTITYFSWKDRLRLLVSGRTELIAYTQTNVYVERAVSTSVQSVLPPRRSKRAPPR